MAKQDALSKLVRTQSREADMLKQLNAVVRRHVRLKDCDVAPEEGPLACITPKGIETALALRVGSPHEASFAEHVIVELVLTMAHEGRIYHVELSFHAMIGICKLKVPCDEYDDSVMLKEPAVKDALAAIGVRVGDNRRLRKDAAIRKAELIAATFEKLRHDLMEASVKESGI